jgi:hypothetical protein
MNHSKENYESNLISVSEYDDPGSPQTVMRRKNQRLEDSEISTDRKEELLQPNLNYQPGTFKIPLRRPKTTAKGLEARPVPLSHQIKS